MPQPKKLNLIKNKKTPPKKSNKGIIIESSNLRKTINDIRIKMDLIKQDKKLTKGQKELALKIFRKKVEYLKKQNKKQESLDPKIKRLYSKLKK